ncbi:11513_t:CDS:2 [Acaulospora morrowiae]|uniref:mitogen-activated protein kinase kinase n=1 Tax=Acaulospora morrowiae TaxID=94023 RepID=A0A9N9A9V8_9GLOM|nr:11513_t:CDS:2 [Acaulospora morrowiae]
MVINELWLFDKATPLIHPSIFPSSPIAVLDLNKQFANLTVTDSKSEVPTSARPTSSSSVKTPILPSLRRSEQFQSTTSRITVASTPVSKVKMKVNRKGPTMKLPDISSSKTPFSNFSRFVDPSGKLNFSGKAILHAEGVDFSNGNSYKINMDEFDLLEELGKGQFGTVKKVFHKPTNVTMAMKEIRLELEESKLNQILMELDILHQSRSEFIVEFYGAFFIESCVYYCMEYMDAGSLDKLYGDGVPEDVLAVITASMVKGLKFLKDKLNIIHRDVKPTNVLVNRAGEVKLCDFGVSGQLTQSLAKTNVGCQSYMAPERIFGDASTYTVQADVWSLGLAMVELAIGKYPYPVPDKNENVGLFAQLTAIVAGNPPSLPADKFSEECRDFVAQCLNKNPKDRPTYGQLLEHLFLNKYENVDMKSWAETAYASRKDIYKQS